MADQSVGWTLSIPIEHEPGARSGFCEVDPRDFGATDEALTEIKSYLAGRTEVNHSASLIKPFKISESFPEGLKNRLKIQEHSQKRRLIKALNLYHVSLREIALAIGFSNAARILYDLSFGNLGTDRPHRDGLPVAPGLVRMQVRIVLSSGQGTAFPVSPSRTRASYRLGIDAETDWLLKAEFFKFDDDETQNLIVADHKIALWDQTQLVPHFAPSSRTILIATIVEDLPRAEVKRRRRQIGLSGSDVREYSTTGISDNWQKGIPVGRPVVL